MDSCSVCPGGPLCRGQQLHLLTLKMFAALEEGVDGAARTLSREEQRQFAELCASAEQACWTKAFVRTVARKLADFAREGQKEEMLRFSVEGMLTLMDGLFSRLPNGVTVPVETLAMDIYNQACVELTRGESDAFLPVNLIGQAYMTFLRRRAVMA